ncbi:MAG: hypothetical protein ACRYGM_18865 [Janthinobacterium lividum]
MPQLFGGTGALSSLPNGAYFAGVGTVLAMPPPGAGLGVVEAPPAAPLTFGLEDGFMVIAPAGALVAGVGEEAPAFGEGGDCVAPWANAGAAARVKARARASLTMVLVSSSTCSAQLQHRDTALGFT